MMKYLTFTNGIHLVVRSIRFLVDIRQHDAFEILDFLNIYVFSMILRGVGYHLVRRNI